MQTFIFVTVLFGVACKIWAGEICCPGLGCYYDSPLYVRFPLPQCPEDMGMNIQLYTRQNPKIGQTISRDIIPSVFRAGVRTIFLVHGWNVSEDDPWLPDVKDTLLKQGEYNVIIVGWKLGAAPTYYNQPVSNTRTVGGEIALISNNTIKSGKSSKALMYCVGHSLGAHACGQAGQQGQFGRITGLDPVAKNFEDRDWKAGLNPFCADLVDAIHTYGGKVGMVKAVGHIDFYPNGGILQPGCESDTNGELLGKVQSLNNNNTAPGLINCHHARAHQFYNESILTPCFLSRYNCSSLYHLPLSCTKSEDAVQSMGYNADSYQGRGIFYLETNSSPPYCLG